MRLSVFNCMDSLVLALTFLSVCIDSCACACVCQCLYGILWLFLRFSVFVRTLVLRGGFLSVCINSSACACVSQCLYGLLCLRLRFSVFVWTLALAFAFLSVCMDSCACVLRFKHNSEAHYCTCVCVSQCCYGLLCLRLRFCGTTRRIAK